MIGYTRSHRRSATATAVCMRGFAMSTAWACGSQRGYCAQTGGSCEYHPPVHGRDTKKPRMVTRGLVSIRPGSIGDAQAAVRSPSCGQYADQRDPNRHPEMYGAGGRAWRASCMVVNYAADRLNDFSPSHKLDAIALTVLLFGSNPQSDLKYNAQRFRVCWIGARRSLRKEHGA